MVSGGGGAARIAELSEEAEWLGQRLALALAALDLAARRDLPTEVTADALAGRMVEMMSEGLSRLEQGYLPPEGVEDALDEKLRKVLIERHSCGECDKCKARERASEGS